MPTDTAAPPMIFLSYRRDDSAGHVGRLYDALSGRFGSQRIFVDIDHISPGQDFLEVVDEAVTRCAVLLVVMGKRWAGTGRIGKRRIDDPGDFVRLEVVGGLRRTGLRMIPVLVGGAKMLGPTELPEDLRDLSRRNAFELSDTRWKEDVARLTTELDRVMGPVGTPATSPAAIATPVTPMPRIDTPPMSMTPVMSATPVTPQSAIKIAVPLPSWSKWAGIAVGAAVAIGVAGFVVRGALAHRAPPPVITAATVAPPPQLNVTADVPRVIPASLLTAGHGLLTNAQQWRGDAELTQIQATLPSGSSSATPYQINYTFRSPADGAGLQVLTGAGGSAAAQTEKLKPVALPTIHALPDDLPVDLPTAVQTARDSGMVGDVRNASLGTATLTGHPNAVAWRIVPTSSDQFHVYYVDANTGKVLHGVAVARSTTPASTTSSPMPGSSSATTTTPTPTNNSAGNLIKKLGGLFHKH
jgi:TIR domain